MTGKIKTLTDRGFGFIARDGEEKDLFFHSKDLNGVTFDELKVGDELSFEIVQGDKGPSAKNVCALKRQIRNPASPLDWLGCFYPSFSV